MSLHITPLQPSPPKFRIFKSKRGEIGPESYWCCIYDCYFHTNNSLLHLIYEIITEWKNDKHLVG